MTSILIACITILCKQAILTKCSNLLLYPCHLQQVYREAVLITRNDKRTKSICAFLLYTQTGTSVYFLGIDCYLYLMSKNEILKAIQHLPVRERIWLIEQTLKSFGAIELKEDVSIAADALVELKYTVQTRN